MTRGGYGRVMEGGRERERVGGMSGIIMRCPEGILPEKKGGWVSFSLPGDIRRGTMHGLENRCFVADVA